MHQISRVLHAVLECFRVGEIKGVQATDDEIELGKAIIYCSMQPFALECALKGLCQQLGIKFPKGREGHDLSVLFNILPLKHQEEIQENWNMWTLAGEMRGVTFEDHVKAHKDDFVQWRYLESTKLESSYLPWFAAIEAVHATRRGLQR